MIGGHDVAAVGRKVKRKKVHWAIFYIQLFRVDLGLIKFVKLT